MDIQENIVNKVAQSGLISLDLADFYPVGERLVYDIKINLFHGLILREKDFREFVKGHDWANYQGKHIAITCTADATVLFGSSETLETYLFLKAAENIDLEKYRDQRVVIKGCGDILVPTSAYVDLTTKLSKVAKSIMYGEPCSTVPIYKRKESL